MNYSIHNPSEANKVNVYKTYSNKDTCPKSCPLAGNGCYADNFHVNLHWSKVSSGERGTDWQGLLDSVKALPTGALWRHNIAGDLRGKGEYIDNKSLQQLTKASKYRKKQGFTYTHYKPNAENVQALKAANAGGFTVNLSSNNVAQAIEYKKLGLPVVTVLPMDAPNVQTVDGVKIVACPSEKSDRVKCGNCADSFCADSKRDFVVGFRAHGTKKKQADIIARG
ncbi:hypothetical protein N9074_01500 [Akkermansiaceae bacterium]|nr:hypothetical protein [Akkermansiaceae bacterium]